MHPACRARLSEIEVLDREDNHERAPVADHRVVPGRHDRESRGRGGGPHVRRGQPDPEQKPEDRNEEDHRSTAHWTVPNCGQHNRYTELLPRMSVGPINLRSPGTKAP